MREGPLFQAIDSRYNNFSNLCANIQSTKYTAVSSLKAGNLHKNGQVHIRDAPYRASAHPKVEICLTLSAKCDKLIVNSN